MKISSQILRDGNDAKPGICFIIEFPESFEKNF